MPIVFSRVEERLIHGQVTYSWSKALNYDVIVVVDDFSANDEIVKSMLVLACPIGKSVYVFNEKTAIEKLNQFSKKVFLIAKSPLTFLNLIKHDIKITSLNIGSTNFAEGKREIFQTVFLSEPEIQAIREMINLGIPCEIQKLPTTAKKKMSELI